MPCQSPQPHFSLLPLTGQTIYSHLLNYFKVHLVYTSTYSSSSVLKALPWCPPSPAPAQPSWAPFLQGRYLPCSCPRAGISQTLPILDQVGEHNLGVSPSKGDTFSDHQEQGLWSQAILAQNPVPLLPPFMTFSNLLQFLNYKNEITVSSYHIRIQCGLNNVTCG